MQAQDATTVYFLKLWPRIEANKKPLIAAAAVLAAAGIAVWFFSAQRDRKEIAGGEALTQLAISQTATPEAYLKLAGDYAGTAAGQRALLQGASALFDQGKYADAQTQFQKFIDQYSDSEFTAQANLGVAACLDAQGQDDAAASKYQRVMSGTSDGVAVSAAKFALARISETKGKFNDALSYYQDVARANPNSSLGSDAMWHVMELKNKMSAPAAPAAPSPVSSPAPFKLTQ